jgi:uncharacterized membrane protein HdeD (DUF308 family)
MTAQHSGPAGRHAQPPEPGLQGETTGHGSDAGLYERETAQAWASAWQVMMFAAVATFAVGLILVVWPKATLIVVAALLGAALLVSGIFRLIHGFAAHGLSGGTRAAYVVIGLLAALVGLYCLRHLDVTVVLLAFLVGVFWTLHGIVDLSVAATSGPGTGRGLRAVIGVLSLAVLAHDLAAHPALGDGHLAAGLRRDAGRDGLPGPPRRQGGPLLRHGNFVL